jgi:1,4-alpha-glucan branching enzyme
MNVYHLHNQNRVIAFHRWLPDFGRDVIIVASLNEQTFYDYSLGFPQEGHWREVFNSDVYDRYFNANVRGNPGGIAADGPPAHDLPASGRITLPANSLLVFARDSGDF